MHSVHCGKTGYEVCLTAPGVEDDTFSYTIHGWKSRAQTTLVKSAPGRKFNNLPNLSFYQIIVASSLAVGRYNHQISIIHTYTFRAYCQSIFPHQRSMLVHDQSLWILTQNDVIHCCRWLHSTVSVTWIRSKNPCFIFYAKEAECDVATGNVVSDGRWHGLSKCNWILIQRGRYYVAIMTIRLSIFYW